MINLRPLNNSPIMEAAIDISISIVFGLVFYLVFDIVSDIVYYFRKKEWISNVGSAELVRQTILFTNDILYYKKIKHFPSLKISYYKHKKFLGVYNDHKIIIYVKNATDAVSIIRITLHEVNHFIQHQTNLKEYSQYEYYSLKYGYNENPLEIECRKFEDEWLEPCLRHLKSKNIIRLH